MALVMRYFFTLLCQKMENKVKIFCFGTISLNFDIDFFIIL